MPDDKPPVADPDPAWSITFDGFEPLHERAVESLFTVTNGYIGSRCSLAEGHASSDPGTFVAGVYDNSRKPGPVPELVRLTDWLGLQVVVEGDALSLDAGEILEHRRMLDLAGGLVTRFWRHRDRAGRITRVRLLHCASLADRHALLQRLEVTAENYSGRIAVDLWVDASLALRPEIPHDFVAGSDPRSQRYPHVHVEPMATGADVLTLRTIGSGITVAFAPAENFRDQPASAACTNEPSLTWIGRQCSWEAELGRAYGFDKLVAVNTSRDQPGPVSAAQDRRNALVSGGTEEALDAHRQAWALQWKTADIAIEGAPDLQRALRFAIYHLAGAVNPSDEHVSIGARGLTGTAYYGHIFWDTEIFMLPFFVLTNPAAARTLLMYRYHTLPAAREKAHQLGYQGALYAWEAADGGEEGAPAEVIGANDEIIPIRSGSQEHHISADVAYAVWQYWQATRDGDFLRSAGAEILVETARFWASRAEVGQDGRFHIRNVVGPDEYHDSVDDDAYSNILARWNLRRGAEALDLLRESWPQDLQALEHRIELKPEEPAAWQHIADGLADGFDPATGLIEQFAGYNALEEIDLSSFEPRIVPIDVLLGHDRVARSKVVKQADVLMALYLLWSDYTPEVREANFRYYEPRTAHGSSLSPGIHAALAARLGDLPRAEHYAQQTAAIDLGDNMGNAADGVHLAALGSLWQAIALGFVGAELRDDRLELQPRLPSGWQSLSCSLCWRGRTVKVSLRADPPSTAIVLLSGPGLRVVVGGETVATLAPGAVFEHNQLGARLDVLEVV